MHIAVEEFAEALDYPQLSVQVRSLIRSGAPENTLYPLMTQAFQRMGYDDSQLFVAERNPKLISVTVGSRKFDVIPDLVASSNGDFLCVSEAKRPGQPLTEAAIQQGLSYAVLTGCRTVLLTNGEYWDLIQPEEGIRSYKQIARSGDALVQKLTRLLKRPGPPLPTDEQDISEAGRTLSTILGSNELSMALDQINDKLRSGTVSDPQVRLLEMMKILAVKMDEEQKYYESGEPMKLIELENEDPLQVAKIIREKFSHLGSRLQPIFRDDREVLRGKDPNLIYEVARRLAQFTFYRTRGDVVGLVYERFLSRVMVGRGIGDFFTPREVVTFTAGMVDPKSNERTLDPAVGTGGFILGAYQHVRNHEGPQHANRYKDIVFGADAEERIATLCRLNLHLRIGNHWDHIFNLDSLNPSMYKDELLAAWNNPDAHGFRVILTNPPFGRGGEKNVRDPERLRHFESPIAKSLDGNPRPEGADPQTLFMELCVRLLRPGGRCGIVIDDGVLANFYMPSRQKGATKEKVYQQFREWFLDNAFLWSVVSLPQKAFEPYGSGAKTSVLIFQKKPKGSAKRPRVFYGRAQFIGYKLQRQKYEPIPENELESPILPEFHNWLRKQRYENLYNGS